MSRIDVEDLLPSELTSTEVGYRESMPDHLLHLLEQPLLSDHSLRRSRFFDPYTEPGSLLGRPSGDLAADRLSVVAPTAP